MINIHAYLLPIIILIVFYLNAVLWNWDWNIYKDDYYSSFDTNLSRDLFFIVLMLIYGVWFLMFVLKFIMDHINII